MTVTRDGKKISTQSNFLGGIADYDKENTSDTYIFGRSINTRRDSGKVVLLPKTVKESSTTVVDLVKWMDRVDDDVYMYGDGGHIYSRSLAGSYADLRTVAGSQGNGLKYYGEDRYLHYTTDKTLGRYGPFITGATKTFADDFLGSEGGVPLNTNSLDLDGTEYASVADHADLSITGNLTLEAYVKPATLPASGEKATLISKWTESSDARSYKLDIVHKTNTDSLDLEASSSQYASIADASQTGLDITGDITLEAWVKFESLPSSSAEMGIIAKTDSAGNQRAYKLSVFNDAGTVNVQMAISDDGAAYETVRWPTSFTTGVWYHIAVVVDVSEAVATEMECYIDGVSEGNGDVISDESVTSIFNSSADFRIGAFNATPTAFLDGLIDEVRVWNDIRTSLEIANNHDVELNGDETGLVGYWKLSSNYLDETSNDNDLTSSGTPSFSSDVPFTSVSGYDLELSISNDGAVVETYRKEISPSVGTWSRYAVAWTASTSTAAFYEDGVSLGSDTGAVTSIDDNASVFAIGASFDGSSVAQDLYDGLIDDVRVYNTVKDSSFLFNFKDVHISATTGGLKAYYKFNANLDDSVAGAHHLTHSGTPTYSVDVPFSSPTSRLDLDQSLDTTGDTYALGTTISESAANRQTFVPTKDPQKSIEVNISAKGTTADWTLTVHDSLNRLIASVTVTNANLSTGDFEFIFDEAWRPIIDAPYHFHLTATNTTGAPAIVSTSNNDMETADFHTYYQFLVEIADHPIEHMLSTMVIGNERYLAVWDGVTYDPHRLTLPSGWKIKCFGFWHGYLAMGCVRGDNIYDYDQGIIFLWDGYSATYNDYIFVAEGGVNALLGAKGKLNVWAGYQGDLLEYVGGDFAHPVKQIPKVTEDTYVEVMPGAVTMYQALLRFGVAGVSDNADIERGVYTYGQKTERQPVALTYDFPISTGNRAASNIKVGSLYATDRKLLIGWKDDTTYGVDVIDPTADPFTSGELQRKLLDEGNVWKYKSGLYVRADFEPLRSGETIRLKYKLDRASSWTSGDLVEYDANNETTVARLPIDKGIHREMQVAVEMGTSVSTSPAVLELSVQRDLLPSEEQY